MIMRTHRIFCRYRIILWIHIQEEYQMNNFHSFYRYQTMLATLLLSAFAAGCGSSGSSSSNEDEDQDNPSVNNHVSVLSVEPAAGAVGVCPDTKIKVIFTRPSSLPMNPATVNATTFSVTGPGAAPIAATSVELDNDTGTVAFFTPQNLLTDGAIYTVNIMGGASGIKDLANPANDMASNFSSTFAAGPASGNCLPVNLGLAASSAIAATAGITNTSNSPQTHINGDVVLDPIQTCNAVNVDNAGGFGPCDSSPPTINGQVITDTFPDTTTSGDIKADLNAAYLRITPSAGPPAAGTLDGGTPIAAPTDLGAAEGSALVVGQNLFHPGVYTSNTSIMISNVLRLDAQGDEDAVFIFQSASTIGAAAGAPEPGVHTRIFLINGTKSSNVWWQAGSSATIGAYSAFKGNLLAAFDITMEIGASNCGRMMAGAWEGGDGALVLDANFITVPEHANSPLTCD
jgi:hypothetical protein